VIAGARLKGQEGNILEALHRACIEIVKLHEEHTSVAAWPDDDAVLPFGETGRKLGKRIADLSNGLLRSKSPFVVVEIHECHVKTTRADARESIEHTQGLGQALHEMVSLCALPLSLVGGKSQKLPLPAFVSLLARSLYPLRVQSLRKSRGGNDRHAGIAPPPFRVLDELAYDQWGEDSQRL